MKIAIIGSGHVGGALAQRFIQAGHTVLVGVRYPLSMRSVLLAMKIGEDRFTTVESAAQQSEVVVLATSTMAAIDVTRELGDTTGKVIIDTMNAGRGRGPEGFPNTTEAIMANTLTPDVAKCFNATGYEIMLDPHFGNQAADMFVCGPSRKAKQVATQLAKDIGFGECYDLGGKDKFSLIEQLAMIWIDLALVQGYGRKMAFKLLKR